MDSAQTPPTRYYGILSQRHAGQIVTPSAHITRVRGGWRAEVAWHDASDRSESASTRTLHSMAAAERWIRARGVIVEEYRRTTSH